MALESAPAGSRLHAADEEGVPVRQIAEAIGHRLGLPVRSIGPDEATERFGPIAGFLSYDNPVSTVMTRERSGWRPQQPGLLAELEAADDLGT